MKKLLEPRKVITGAATVDPDVKKYSQKHHSYSMTSYYWIKILDNTWKQ